MRSSPKWVWWPVVVGLVVLLSSGIITGRQRTVEPPPQEPRLLRLEVFVVGPDGLPIRGLTRDDFDVFDRGVRRPIGTFREVGGQQDDEPALSRPPDAGSGIATNTHVEADHLVVLVLDDLDAEAGRLRALRGAARRVMETLGADGPVGIIRTSGAAGVELTRDRGRLMAVLDRLGTGMVADPSEATSRLAAGRQPFEAVADAASLLQGPPGRRRVFVWVAAGASADPDELTGPQAQRFLQASREAGVILFVVDDTGTTSLRDLAERTGGGVVAVADLDAVATRLAAEREHQYWLGLPLGEGDGDGSGIEVRVRRDGASARYRLGPLGVPADRPPAGRELTSPVTRVVPDADLPLRLFAAAGPHRGRDARVMVTFEMRAPRAPLEAVDPRLLDEIDYELAAFDLDSDRVVRRRDSTEVAALRPRNGAPGSDDVTFEVTSSIDVAPGDYQLRVAARSRTLDRAGSVYLSLHIPDFQGAPIEVGGLILGFEPPPGATDEGRDPGLDPTQLRMLRPVFGGGGSGLAAVVEAPSEDRMLTPAFDRLFERWEPLRLRFEVSQQPPRPGTSALVEIVDGSDRRVHASHPTVATEARSVVEVELPLARLGPGPYRVRVRVTSDSGEVGREAAFVVNGVPLSEDLTERVGPAAAGTEGAGDPPRSTGPPAAPPAGVPVSDPPPPGGAATTLRMRPDLVFGEPRGAESDANVLASEGWERYGRGDVEGAQAKLAAAVEAGTDSPWIHYARGLAEFALGRFEVAATSWELVRRTLPDYEPVYFDLTDAYLSLDRTGDARDVLRDAVERWPGDPEVHNAMGVVLFGRQELDDAIAAFQHAIEAAPDDGLGYFNLGRAYQARMMRWRANRTVRMASAVDTLAERDRQHAVEALTRALELGGSFDWEAREALRVLVRTP